MKKPKFNYCSNWSNTPLTGLALLEKQLEGLNKDRADQVRRKQVSKDYSIIAEEGLRKQLAIATKLLVRWRDCYDPSTNPVLSADRESLELETNVFLSLYKD